VNFDEALQYLLSLGHETLAMKLGLRNTELLLERLGNPHSSYQSVQIAGTNGKGSTAVMLDSICRAGGIRTGLYTSPHLISITERIKIEGNEISTAEFAELATEVRRAAKTLLTENKIEAMPTFFEHVTAIALLAFKKVGLQLAILETGLGGRLDATTVAGATTVAITPVAMDHEEYLGHTISEIASEKAAIIRPGVNAIIGHQTPEPLKIILNRSAEVDVVPDTDVPKLEVEKATYDGRYTVSLKTTHDEYEHLTIGLRGHHQIENASLAIRIAESIGQQGLTISKTAIREGIETATYSGRLELIEGAPRVLLDGAHNPAGASALRQYLDEHMDGPITMVFGAMKDKKLDEIAQLLFPKATQLIITAPRNPRAAAPEHLRKLAIDHLSHTKTHVAISAGAAMRKAKEVTPPGGLICVTGSLYLVGEVKSALSEVG
jgi:dihydrofolate synthase/folylpolyglutamate synthase